MSVVGIIAEYNPFHNGHSYQIENTKQITDCESVVCVMSGNFVQRGEPAIIDKWTRTKMALMNGVDLVIELPVIYSLSSAEFFAQGAVSLLNNLGIIDYISFGSELGDNNILLNIASILNNEPQEYKTLLKESLSKGNAFPAARSWALEQYFEKNSVYFNSEINLNAILNSSNNILGIEYCKALLKLNSSIKPITIKRRGAEYNEKQLNNSFSSATSIREYLKEQKNIELLMNTMPHASYNIINALFQSHYDFTYLNQIIPFLKYKALTYPNTLKNLPDVSEGLENRIISSILKFSSLEDIITNIKSRRYTYTRITRILCQYFIGFENFDIQRLRLTQSPYARILGFNTKGRKILNQIKKSTQINLYTKLPSNVEEHLKIDLLSTKAYSMLNTNVTYNADYLNKPIIIE